MAYFAKVNDLGVVEKVISVSNLVLGEPHVLFPETEQLGSDFIVNTLGLGGNWKQTSYNRSFRKNYAGVGFLFDESRNAFIPPRPYPSWLLDEQTCLWVSPVPYPQDQKMYIWDEEEIAWKEVN